MKNRITQCIEQIEKTVLDLEAGVPGAMAEVISALGLAHVKLPSQRVIALLEKLSDQPAPGGRETVTALLGLCEAHKRLLYSLAGLLDEETGAVLGLDQLPAEAASVPASSPAPAIPASPLAPSAQASPTPAPPTGSPEGAALWPPEGTQAGNPPAPSPTPAQPPAEAASHAPAAAPQALARPESISSIRVNTEKLDNLIELVGKLLVTFAVVSQDGSMQGRVVAGLKEMDQIIDQIKTEVEHIRLVPLRQIFTPMHRLVSSLAQKTGKKVRLELSGEDLELDKKLVEAINEPLVHLLRNAVDHGLEPPEDRAAAGKPETGTVLLAAERKGEFAILKVVDDGRGLNAERIAEKARERGLWDENREYAREEIFRFIMHSGFSTASQITDVSGRGVGMDAVLVAVQERLSGEVLIQSEPGMGATFTLSVPLSRAVDQGIAEGLVCAVGGERFILPSRDILEIYQPLPSDLTCLPDGREVLSVRSRMEGIIRLDRFLDLEQEVRPAHECQAVLAKVGDRRAAILVDEVLRQQQVVITGFTVPVHALYGLPILGYGMMGESDALVLNIEELLRMGADGPD
jgi:two-component system chemotaxis sensor kinase CheA